MKKMFKKVVSVILVVIMCLTMVPLGGFDFTAEAATITSYSQGDIIEFGWYPQSKVTDSTTISALNSAGGEWISYNYYSGTGSSSDGKMTASDYMRYKDVIYGSDKYRGVVFDSYRPYYTGCTSSSSYTYQDENGFFTNTVYWFKYEPIMWRVLDPVTGMVMSESILDSQPYNNYVLSSGTDKYGYTACWGDSSKTYYANNYAESSLRQWLNNDFYNTAFSKAQQDIIKSTTLDNSAFSDSYSEYDSASTKDKIFLLSYNEVRNSNFGFNSSSSAYDTARRAQGSDYAQSQGLYVYRSSGSTYNGNSYWLLRSPYSSSIYCCNVNYDGGSNYHCYVFHPDFGVRPALNFNLTSEIFQSDVKDTGNSSANGASVANINKKNTSFTITTKQNGYNESFFELTGVECYIGAKKINQNESKFEILQGDLNADITLKKDGFRDYIIPCEVAQSFSDGYNFDAYMSLAKPDGKAYISSVFGKNSSEDQYQDLIKTSMIAENYNTYDIIVSGVGLSSKAKYHIGQDLYHAIQSDTSTFEAKNLYSELTHNKSVYAYAVDNGKATDLVELSLSKSNDDGALKRILETSTYSLGGSGGITIKIPDENPIFGNSEISLKAFSAPLTVYYDTTNDTYIGTIGFDLYSYTEKDKTVSNASGSYTKFGDGETKKAFQNFKESFSYFNKTPFAEDEKDKNGVSYKDQWTSFVNRCKTASKYSQKYYDKNFSADFLGYLEFAVTEQGFTVKEASLKIGAEFSYSYTYQGAVWVIPAYFKATLGASASLEGKGKRAMVNRDIPFEYEITLDIEPKLALEAGIGVEKLAKAGVEAKGTAPFKVEFFNQHLTLKFHGEINIKTKAFVFTWDKKLVDGDLDILDKYWGKTKTFALRQTAGVPQYAVLVDDNEVEDLTDYYNESTSISDRNYAENTSEWLDNGIMLMALEDSEVTVKQLQTSVLEDGKPVAVAFGDKVLMAWVEDCSDRDTFNRMRLMYSIYNGTYWSEPEAVYDDGKNDDAPVLATDGTDVYFAWQKINAILDENSVVTDALQQVDICTAKYDSSSGAIKDAKIICSDNGYDYAQAIAIDNGKPIVYFATCSDPSVAVSFNSKINKYENNAISTIVSLLSFVQSIAADGNNMSFVIDTDGDLSTSDDINAFSYSSGYSTEYEKKDISTAIIGTYYGHIDDKKVMFVTDGTNIYYDLNGERKSVFTNSQNISSLNLVEENGNPAFLWTEDIESGNQICYVCYDGTSWSSPVVLTKAEGYYFDSLDMVNYNDNLVGVFMQDELKYNSNSESYDISQVNLAYVTIEDYMDLKVGSIFVEEETLVPGDTAEICVYVENLGTETINNVEFTLSDSISNVQITKVELGLAPGENKNIYIDYIVPENFKQTTLSVSAEIMNEIDVDTTNNSFSEPIGLPDIRITKTECVLDGNYYVITAFINNNSVSVASDINAKLWIDEEDGSIYHEAKIVSLSNDECGYVQFYVEESSLTFDETNTAKLYLVAESEGSKYGRTATECILITKSENECGHPLTETITGTVPTCTEDGTSDYEVCLVCGENVTESEVIPARHSLGDWYISIPAKCELIGKKQRDCSECDYSETQEIPAVKHSYEAVITPATCYSNGFTTNTCTKCGNGYTSNITAMLTHNFSDWYTVTDATCEANGIEQRDCSACNYSETQNIPATGHNYNNGVCTSCGDDLTANCSCNCHKSGIVGFFWKILKIFYKLFKTNPVCECGAAHY